MRAGRRAWGLVAATAVAVALIPAVAASQAPAPLPPSASWLYSCGGQPYPKSIFREPTGAEDADTEQAAALRRAVRKTSIETLPDHGWLLGGETAQETTFVARPPRSHPRAFEVTVEREPDGSYEWAGSSHWCKPQARLENGSAAGSWRLDPDRPAPRPGSTKIHALVEGVHCDSGRPHGPRIGEPPIEVVRGRIVIASLERPPNAEFSTCQGGPPAKFTFHLPEPIGDRPVLDGAYIPFKTRVPAG